jgi:L-fuconolactonase
MSTMRVCAACLVLLAARCLTLSAAAQTGDIALVDTHVHLWSLERPEGIYWIAKDDQVLRHNFLPRQHEPIAKANGVRAVVLVQAGQALADNQWCLDISRDNPRLYQGVVGNLSKAIGTDEFQPLFSQLCRDPRYRGYRLSGRYQEQLTDAFFRDLNATAAAGRTIDILVEKYTLDDVAEIARRVPNLKIMLDHLGNVRLDGSPLKPDWVAAFRRVAKHPNVSCKVSALFGRVAKQPAPQDLAFYRPVLELAWECFGEDRLVFGSDWPVTNTTDDYASVLKLTRAYFAPKGPEVSAKFLAKNAVRFYGLSDVIVEP